jgi:hypothetical protein
MSSFTQPPTSQRPATAASVAPRALTAAPTTSAAPSAVPSAVPSTGASAVASATGGAAPPARTARLPDAITMQNAVKLAISEDKPIMMDYWVNSLEQKVVIGIKNIPGQEQERLLVKNEEEYTSPIAKIFKSAGDYIIMTENSIYVVDNQIKILKIT